MGTDGGYDTRRPESNQANGTYTTLMTTLNDALLAFYNDLLNQTVKGHRAAVLRVRAAHRENASNGTDHGAGGVMLAMGGARGDLRHRPISVGADSPALGNGADVRADRPVRLLG